MISVIMPSYLGNYKKAAKDRDKKIFRAIRSVQNQTYKYWELIVIADGCLLTKEIVTNFQDPRIRLIFIPKQPTWSGRVRNAGLEQAKGEYACYLDIDDVFGEQHLEQLSGFSGRQWYWFDDYIWAGNEFRWKKRSLKIGNCGTSNVIHKPGIARWREKGTYAHDWLFIKDLQKASGDYEYIKAGQYCICHVPGAYDV